MIRRSSAIAILLLAICSPSGRPLHAEDEPAIDFVSQIQPIFAKRCFKCHGPNEDEAGLRLSNRDAAVAELDSGTRAIVPGDVKASHVLERLRSSDDDQRMPPEGKPVSAADIALIEKWIASGAPWSAHWSYTKPTRPELPKSKTQAWVHSPIDAFILSKLEQQGLKPAAPADKVALIRRAYYNLIGLPPSPKDVDAFVADTSPQAFEKVVDRLLDSPQYGEKWARHWLDLVRYAETNGYERDGPKDLMWRYRDYVITALNENKPFDRFILEQLSGDDLPDKTGASLTATGFYRLGTWDDEPADRELARYDYLDDIVRTTSEAFLGMTIGCARCHDHKIDPIAQKDYYSMLSMFSDISPHGKGKTNHVAFSSPDADEAYKATRLAKQKREAQLRMRIATLEKKFLEDFAIELPGVAGRAKPPGVPEDGILLSDSIKVGQEWEYTFKKPADDWFEIAFDDSKWKKGPGGFGTQGTPGSVVRTTWRTPDIWMRKDFRLVAIPDQLILRIHHDENATIYINNKLVTRLRGYVTKYKDVDITEQVRDALQTGRNTLAIHCHQTGGGQYIDAGLMISKGATPIEIQFQKYGKKVMGPEKLAEWNRLRRDLKKSESQEIPRATAFAMAVAERGRQKTWLLGRGLPSMKGDEVGPAFPQILNPPAAEIPKEYDTGKTSGKRRVLAEWIASGDNPMTARVLVNRIWQHHFGRGIVRTTSDFGFQGSPPTHPKLLDWLATELVAGGWKVKELHKKIMMSSTYQMSSAPNASAAEKDPTNDLFWRFNMRRLTAEEIRDSILAVNGTLNPKMFGPSIFPPLPAEVLATSSKPGSAWGKSSPEDSVRRSIYIHVKRSLRHPMMTSFDAPDADNSCSARVATTVPTQALGMLNSQFMKEQASKLSARLQKDFPKDLAVQLAYATRLTTGRKAQPEEIAADVQYIEELQQQEKLSLTEALQQYCLLMLNTNEFFYLD